MTRQELTAYIESILPADRDATVNALTSQMATIPEVEDLSFRQAYAILRARGFEKIEIEYVPGDFKDLALGVELHGRVLQKGEHVQVLIRGTFLEGLTLAIRN